MRTRYLLRACHQSHNAGYAPASRPDSFFGKTRAAAKAVSAKRLATSGGQARRGTLLARCGKGGGAAALRKPFFNWRFSYSVKTALPPRSARALSVTFQQVWAARGAVQMSQAESRSEWKSKLGMPNFLDYSPLT